MDAKQVTPLSCKLISTSLPHRAIYRQKIAKHRERPLRERSLIMGCGSAELIIPNELPSFGVCLCCLHIWSKVFAEDFQPPARLIDRWTPRVGLETAGIQPYASLTTEAWGNIAGGLKTGAWWNQLLDFGLQLDTTKLGAWSGGYFLAQFHWVQNSQRSGTFGDYTGAINPVSGIMASDHFRVYNLYFQQSCHDQTVLLKAGQLAADDDFMCSSYTGLFANSAFGALPSQVGNRLGSCCGFSPAFPIFPVAAPGIFLRVQPCQPFYIQSGLYYGRPGVDRTSNLGFDWVTESPPEAGIFFEGGYSYHLGTHAAILRFGGTHHTGRLEDFAGVNAGNPDATKQSEPNFYAIHDLELVRHRNGQALLGVFWRGGMTPSPDRSMVVAYTDAGINWLGPLPGRADDVAGVGVSYTRFGREFRLSTGPNGIAADETALEIAYKAELAKWFSLQADVQLLFNPALQTDAQNRKTATVLGLRAKATF